MKRSVAVAVSVSMLGGCAINGQTGNPEFAPGVKKEFTSIFANPDPCSNRDRNIATLVGGTVGAVAGHFIGKNTASVLIGGAAGGLLGLAIGHALDQRRCNLYHVAQQYNMKLASAPITMGSVDPTAPKDRANDTAGLDVQMGSVDEQFIPGTATLTPRAREYLGKVAEQYSPAAVASSVPSVSAEDRKAVGDRQLLIVGHTDERDNVVGAQLAQLSEARAKAVALVFQQHGVPASRIAYQGAGDAMPIESNATAQGRSDNNRVEVVDVPSAEALKQYVNKRAVNPANFGTANASAGDAADLADQPAGTMAIAEAAPVDTVPAKKGRKAPRQRTPAKSPVHASTAVDTKQASAAANAAPASTESSTAAAAPTTAGGDAAAVAQSNAPVVLGLQGQLMGKDKYQVNLGTPHDTSVFSFITSAHAAAPVVIGSCLDDHPHISGPIRSLASNRPLDVDDALPGLFGQPWFGQQGQSSVALLHVYVPSDAAAPVPPVTAEIYHQEGEHFGAPVARFADSPVNVYRGTDATLYRVFLHGSLQCLDLRVPTQSKSANGLVVYDADKQTYKAPINFSSKG